MYAVVPKLEPLRNTYNKLVESLPKKLISNLTNEGVLQSLYRDFTKEICTEKNEEKRSCLFRKKNVIEFSIFLKSPELNFKSSDALKNELINDIIDINIALSRFKIFAFIYNINIICQRPSLL